MEKQIQFLLNYMDELDLTSFQNPPRPTIENGIKIERNTSHDHKAINANKIVNRVSTKNNKALKMLNDSPIKDNERFDEWNEERKYNRYRRDSDESDCRERHGRSRSRERLKNRFRQRSRSRDRRGRSKSRFRQRSKSRTRRGRSNSRFRQQSRSRLRRGRSKSRYRQRSKSRDRRGRSKSRDRRGRSKSIDKYYHDRNYRTERSDYSKRDRNTHDYIEKHKSSSREKHNNSSADRDVSREYDMRSERSGSRVYNREVKHIRTDTYSTISYRDQHEVEQVMDYDNGSNKGFQLKNLTYKYKHNKPSSTVTSSDIQISAAHFNDTPHELSKTEQAYQHTYYRQIKDKNDQEEVMHSQYQMEKKTNPNNLQSPVSSVPTNRVRRYPCATDVPFQNYTRNCSDYSSSISNNVELPKYQQSTSTNATTTTTYGQHKQQNLQDLQVAPSVSKNDISKSHLDKVYRSGEYSIPSLYSTTSESFQKFRIPKKKPICTVTQDIQTTGNYSRVASESQQSNKRGGYDSADLRYEFGDIDQRHNKTTRVDNWKLEKPSPTEIQESIVKASSSVLANDQTTAKKEEEVESIFKTLINPSSLAALINLLGKVSDAGKSNEVIQTPTPQTNPVDTNEQNDINFMTTTKAEKIVKVKKPKRKRISSWSRGKLKRKSRSSTKAASQNEADNQTAPSTNKNIKQKAKLRDDVTKPILRNADTTKADVVKPKQRHAVQEVDSSEPESPKKLRKVSKSSKRMEPTIVADHLPAKRARMTKERDVTLYELEPSDLDDTFKPSDTEDSFSSDAGTNTNKNRKVGAANIKYKSFSDERSTLSATANRRRLSANQKRIASEAVPQLDSAITCRGLHTEVDKTRQRFTKVDDFKPKSEPSSIKNNNPEWHCMNQRLECLHCDKNTGISLANHYVSKHPDCEVFPCRLSPDIAEFLRNTTEEHKCERRKHKDRQPYEFRQRCYFCDKYKLYTKVLWLQHLSVHTGCYEFECKYCLRTFSAIKKDHACIGKKNCVRKFKYPPFHRRDGIVYGYVCDLCNFIRFKQSEIEKHLRCEHEGEVDGKFRKVVLLTFPKKKKKHEIKAEEEALKLANAIKATTETKPLDPLISNDDEDIAIVIKTDYDYEIGQRKPKKEADIDTTRTIEENMPIVILDSDDSDKDSDWISCSDDDEINDNISTNLQPSTSTQVGYVEILPEIISQVEEVIIKKESDSQTTDSLGGMSQQQIDVITSTTHSIREVPDANIEESKSLIDNKIDAATAYKKIVIEAITPADNEIADIIATDFSSTNSCSFTLNATSDSDDTVDMNEFNFGTNVQSDSDLVTTVQQSPEIAFTPSTLDETDFLKISNVTSLVQQSSSSSTANEVELTDIAGISNEEFMGIIEEMIGSPNTGMTFSNILENYEFETLCDQQLTSTQTAKTSMMQEIVELPDKTSKVSTTPMLWTTMQHEIDNAASNLVKGTGLAVSDLYRCCLTNCDEKYTDSSALEMHLLSHDQSHTNLKCYHCPMACKTIVSLMHHIETHGIHRYFCYYCLYTNATLYNVWQHMWDAHDRGAINSIPLNRNKTDDTNDLFVVFPTGLEEEELVSFASTLIERSEHKLLS